MRFLVVIFAFSLLSPAQNIVLKGGTYPPNLTPPKLTRAISPQFPEGHHGEDASVTVRANVGKDGRVKSANVLKSLNADFDRKALEAVKQWEYEPARFNGQPVDIVIDVIVDFHGASKKNGALRDWEGTVCESAPLPSPNSGATVPGPDSPAAQMLMGCKILKEDSSLSRYDRARPYIQNAANGDLTSAAVLLAEMDWKGGDRKDYVEALKWFRIAQGRGTEVPAQDLDGLLKAMNSDEITKGELAAVNWLSTHLRKP